MSVSIIIPTRNRHRQLYETIIAHKALPKNFRQSVQLVLADNSPDPIQEIYLQEMKEIFPHLIYENDRGIVSMEQNYLRGLKLSTNEWLCIIGDDDFFLPEIAEAIRSYDDQPVDCVIYNPPKYYWPNCVFANTEISGAPGAYVPVKPFRDEFVNVQLEINRCIRNGGLTIGRLPRLYHGLVRRGAILNYCLNEDHEFNLGSPDISLAFYLALGNVTVVSHSKPLTVYGASAGSGGGMSTSKTHILPLDEAHHLSQHFRENWDDRIPRYWSEFTVFPASILYVSKLKKISIESNFSFSAIYSAIIIYELSQLHYVKKALFEHPINKIINITFGMPFFVLKKLLGSIYRKNRAILSKNFQIFQTASDFFEELVK